MPQSRKTRQQKIQQSQRKPKVMHSEVAVPVATSVANSDLPLGLNQEVADTQLYVVGELKRIGWITVICVMLLALATLFLADFSWAEAARNWLPF